MLAAYSLRSPGASLRREFLEQFWASLRGSLGAARGAALEFEWEWRSGPEGAVRLVAKGADADVWAGRVLLPAYPSGSFTRQPLDGEPDLGPGGLVARPLADLSIPFAFVQGGSIGWADAVVRALPSGPAGARARWTFRPVRLPTVGRGPAPPDVEARAVPRDGRLAPLPALERELRDRIDERRRDLAWAVRGRLSGTAPAVRWLAHLVEGVARFPGGNGIRFARPSALPWRRPSELVVDVAEALGWFPSPTVRYVAGRERVRPGTRFLSTGFGERAGSGRLALEPGEGRHLVIVGETGMGKSSLLVHLASQLTTGESLALFDPIGETARRWLCELPECLLERVIWVSPAASPIGINALSASAEERGRPESGGRTRADLITALRRVRESRFRESTFWGPRIEEVLHHALTVAARLPNGTLEDAIGVFDGLTKRGRPVPSEARPSMEWLEDRSGDRRSELEGARRLLAEVSRDPVLVRMLAERNPRFALDRACRPGEFLVVCGDVDRTGESTVRYLFSVYLALLWNELLSRPSPHKVVVALDEAQWYAHDALAEALRLGRRQNIHVWLATQSLESLGPAVREAIETNVADFAVFRGSADTALRFSRVSRGLAAESLFALPRRQFVLLRGKGEEVAWMRCRPSDTLTKIDARLGRVVAGSRRYLAVASDPAGSEGARVPGAGGPEIRSEECDVRRRLVLTIAAGLERASPGSGSVPIPLDRLRRTTDPTGFGVRRLGAELRRAGRLERVTRDAEGPVWTVRATGLLEELTPPPDAAERAAARLRWKQLAEAPVVPAPEKDYGPDPP